MAWYVIKPWLDMISSQGLIYYQAMAWYINKPWLDLLSNHGLIYYQTMAWYVFKTRLDILSSHLYLSSWRHSENWASSEFWLDACVLTYIRYVLLVPFDFHGRKHFTYNYLRGSKLQFCLYSTVFIWRLRCIILRVMTSDRNYSFYRLFYCWWKLHPILLHR